MEVSRATRAYGAYIGDELVGALLADMNGKKPLFHVFIIKWPIIILKLLIILFYSGAYSGYQVTNRDMLTAFHKRNKSDGELNYFAVDPRINGKGIGRKLLNRLQEDETGKRIYLFTDSGCTYQFYEHRGFRKEEHQDVELDFGMRIIPIT